jgi:endonuclease-8
MPEGHTIHRLARDQSATLVGRRLNISSPQGRFATGAQMLDGRQLHSITACGKHLFYQFDQPNSGPVLHVHLGLFGKYRVRKRTGDDVPEVRGATRVRFVSPDYVVDLNGPNQCEVIEPQDMQSIIDRLGPDPLRDDAQPKRAWDRIRNSRAGIGQLIMDQSVMAGIGNIYRTELLFRTGLSPHTPGCKVSRSVFNRLWKDAVKLLNIGVKHNRIITVYLEKIATAPSKLRYGEQTLIFGKTKCPQCGSPITRFEIANRRAFRCDSCQSAESCVKDETARHQALHRLQTPHDLATQMGPHLDPGQVLQRRLPPKKKRRRKPTLIQATYWPAD